MNYTKPEIALINAATAAIQGFGKSSTTQYDNIPLHRPLTVPAYEGDE